MSDRMFRNAQVEVDLSDFNETDVREEIASPLLHSLGYAKGTDNDILRERDLKLEYPHLFLGRKKPGKDPVLRGRADYILRVIGVCRWVFEIKAPDEPIDRHAIEQALSYARHPEVNADLIALLNGREFVLYRVSQLASEEPLMRLDDCRVEALHAKLENVLSPTALRRDLRPREIDLGLSIGGGLRSSVQIIGGNVVYDYGAWDILECPPGTEAIMLSQLDQQTPISAGSKFSVDSGSVQRSAKGAIVAKIKWDSPYEQMDAFMQAKGLFDLNYVCLDPQISTDPASPSTFDYFFDMRLEHGEDVFDMMQRETTIAQLPVIAESYGQASGFLEGNLFKGQFQSETMCTTNAGPLKFVIAFRSLGKFEIRLAT
ncbi:MAG: hypothetical protein AAFN91_17485 [Pseudomonadota bacterium]